MSNNHETILKNRYRLLAQQGAGGMAVIYKAHDLELSRIVAIKILRPSLTTDPTFLTRFRNEARSAANLIHPNIVTVYDVGSEGQTQFIVMEFVDGQDLKKIIKTEGMLDINRALKIVIQICAGIGYAHRSKLVHADVKPQNILITKEDIVKVTDFGIAQAFSDSQPAERQQLVWGSPHYFAPEQARGEKPTPESDVYAIGIVLFELLTGRLPYLGQDQQQLALAHIRDRVPLVTEFNPRVPESLAEIVAKVMSKEPTQRYRTADQLGQILETFRSKGLAQTAANISPARPSPQPPLPAQNLSQTAPYSQPQPPIVPPVQPTQPYSQPQIPVQPPQYPPPPVRPQSSPAGYDPTQRYSAVPQAPEPSPYNRPTVSQPFNSPPVNQPIPPYQQQTAVPNWGSSQPLYRAPDIPEDLPSALDAVTIALAVLAFFAVLCLIPLWVQVYLVRFAGG
jgi:serine/threonine-protein kinase